MTVLSRQSRLVLSVVAGLAALVCLYTYRAEQTDSYAYPASGITAVSARSRSGNITLTAGADSLISVQVQRHAYGSNQADADKALQNVTFHDTTVGSELQLEAQMPSGSRPYGATLTLSIRESTALALSTTNGDVSVTGTVGAVHAATTNGDVQLVNTRGPATLATTDGAVAAQVHSGGLAAGTTNGRIDCDLAELGATEACALSTTNGYVTLLLPDDVSATIDATTTAGTITIHDFTVRYDQQTSTHVHGQIGSGASDITISTTNGDIVVRRRS